MITRFVGNPKTIKTIKDTYIDVGTAQRPRFQPAASFGDIPVYTDCRIPVNEVHFDWDLIKDVEHICDEDNRCGGYYALPSD